MLGSVRYMIMIIVFIITLIKMSQQTSSNFSRVCSITLVAIATSLVGCNTETTQSVSVPNLATTEISTALPEVVATNSVICGLTKQIAGDTINLKCLITPGADPHVYEPKPDDRKAIDSAKLILYGGYEFEPSLIKIIQASSNPAPKIAINENAVPNPLIAEGGHSHDYEKERNQEDKTEKKEVDPHVWNDAKNGIKIAQSISKSLSTLRPDRSDTYAQNTTRIVAELERIDTWIKLQVSTIPPSSRHLITTHDALGYYAKAYGLPIEGALSGISTEEQPTPTRVRELVKVIKDANVPTIFAEVTINPKLITAVAKEANVKVSERELYADGLGETGSEGETYAGMMIANTKSIVEGLGGKFVPFQPETP
jgi:manganese/iron transport system substrate-binding protein